MVQSDTYMFHDTQRHFMKIRKKSICMLSLNVKMTENQSFVVASICILLKVLMKKKFQVYFTYNLPSTDEKKLFSSERVSLRNYSVAGGDKKGSLQILEVRPSDIRRDMMVKPSEKRRERS